MSTSRLAFECAAESGRRCGPPWSEIAVAVAVRRTAREARRTTRTTS